jgi:Na+-transporting NADH:ubiquinone oxidoreductase subunit B
MALVKLFLMQKPMIRVCYALIPPAIMSIYLFGWRSLFLIMVVLGCGVVTEAVFTLPQKKPVTSAIFVTCLVFALSLPPNIPVWMAVIGIVVGVVFGKMVFGGFGQNVFNPAMVGRCFIYISFPVELTNHWAEPMWGGLGGFSSWSVSIDAITQATPLLAIKEGALPPLHELFFGNISGSMGETSALLILLGGIYIIYKKSASWRLALSCLLGGIVVFGIQRLAEFPTGPPIVHALFSGAFLFGCAFVVTEPVSGAKTRPGQWIYGFLVGGLTIVFRRFSNFSEGFMFAVLLMNAFVPILDYTVRRLSPGATKKDIP